MKIQNNNVWFTADLHGYHKNIIKYCNRPFDSIDSMNETLIENHNSLVQKEDIVFNLGDFAWGGLENIQKLRQKLNGKIILIRGNHDPKQTGQLLSIFDGVYDYLEIDVADKEGYQGWQPIVLCHYAFKVWNRSHNGSWSLYGHSHGTLPDDPMSKSFDVGVDCHDYKPMSYSEVKNIMKTKKFISFDDAKKEEALT